MSETATAGAGSAGYDAADEFLDRQTPLQKLQSLLHTYPWLSPLVVLILSLLVFSIVADRFATASNFGLIIQQAAVVATLGIGQTLIILTAGIDLSCGAVMIFSSMVAAKTAKDSGLNGFLALALGLIVGVLAGLLNGLLITRLNLPPFIVTLGTLGIFTSLTLLYASGRTVRGREMPSTLTWLGKPIAFGEFRITYGVIAMLLMYALFAYILRYTRWGTHVYAVGDDPDAARLAGIEVKRVLLSVYVVAGLVFAIAGWLLIGRLGSASPNAGPDANLNAITAVVIGGTSLFGGRGRIVGTLIGALIVAVVESGLTLADLDEAYKRLAIGILIIAAVSADQWIRRARA